MEENLKKRFMNHINQIKMEDAESEAWHKLDEGEKLLYRTVDVVEFFRQDVLRQYQDKPLAKEFENVWHYLLGTIEMKDYDPRKYSTSLD